MQSAVCGRLNGSGPGTALMILRVLCVLPYGGGGVVLAPVSHSRAIIGAGSQPLAWTAIRAGNTPAKVLRGREGKIYV
jgi:hypothetical protein